MRELIYKALVILAQSKDTDEFVTTLKHELSPIDYQRLINANLFTILSSLTIEDLIKFSIFKDAEAEQKRRDRHL